jgi:hypothetical protein
LNIDAGIPSYEARELKKSLKYVAEEPYSLRVSEWKMLVCSNFVANW